MFPVIWTVIAVIEPRLKIFEIKVGPCRQMSCHVKWRKMCKMCESSSLCHPNTQKQLSDDSTSERQSSNQTRERTIERADEPPTQRPRLENPATSIRWSRVDDPRHWVPAAAVDDEENMWTEMDSEVLWQQQVDDHIWENNGKPVCLCQEEWDDLFINTCENVTAQVSFCQSEFNDPW